MTFPSNWIAAPLVNQCCRSFLASFKIWNMATVGGNLCMSLPAGPMISLTSALDGVCTIWTAGRRRAARRRDRFRIGAATQRAEAGRIASRHRPAARGAAPAHGLPSNLAQPARPLRRALDRHAVARRRSVRSDRDGGDAASDPPVVSRHVPSLTGCARNSKPKFRKTLLRRHPRRAGMAPACDAAICRRDPRRTRRQWRARHELSGQRQEPQSRAAGRPMPAHVSARSRMLRREEGMRRRRLRRLHSADRRRSGAFLPVSCLSRQGASLSRRSKDWRATANCIPCKRPSCRPRASSAASARRE